MARSISQRGRVWLNPCTTALGVQLLRVKLRVLLQRGCHHGHAELLGSVVAVAGVLSADARNDSCEGTDYARFAVLVRAQQQQAKAAAAGAFRAVVVASALASLRFWRTILRKVQTRTLQNTCAVVGAGSARAQRAQIE